MAEYTKRIETAPLVQEKLVDLSRDYDQADAIYQSLLSKRLQAQLAEKKVNIALTEAARTWLAQEGHDPEYGARPLRRLVMQEVGDVLAEEILFGRLSRGGEAKVGIRNKKLVFSYKEKSDGLVKRRNSTRPAM